MTTRLSQILGVIQGVNATSQRELTDLHHAAQRTQQDGPLNGQSRTYQPREDDGEVLPPKSTRVQTRATELITQATATLTRLLDVTATRDWANCDAKADVKVGTHTILEGVPVPYLLFLAKRLTDLRTFIAKLPTLDPAETWAWDDAADCWATEPVYTTSTKKIPRNHVLAAATDKHPAQVQVYQEDQVVGTWRTVKFSGAMPAHRVRELLERVEELRNAVQYAIAEANSAVVADRHVGKKILDYVFD